MKDELLQPKTGLGSVEETNRLLQGASKQTGIAAPTFSPMGTITSESLAGNTNPIDLSGPTKAFNDAATKSTVSGAGISGATEAKITTGQKELQDFVTKQEADAKAARDTAQKGYLEKLGLKSSAIEDKAAAYKTPEFLAKQKASNDAYSELQQSKQAKLNEIDALNKQVLSPEQKNNFLNEITNKYALRDANLSVTYDVANRDYQSAISNIDNATQLKLEAVQPFIDYFSTTLNDANVNWTAAEKNILDQKVREYTAVQDDAKAVGDAYKTLMTNNAGAVTPALANQLSKAKNTNEFYDILARNNISLAKPESGDGAPTVKSINGVDMQWNPASKKWDAIGADNSTNSIVAERGIDRISQLQSLINNVSGLNSNAGLIRGSGLRNLQNSRDWSADVINVLSRLTVDELGRVKSDGVTFGALSDPERKAVGDAASSLNAGMEMKDGVPTGKFKLSEDKVRKELETIKKYAELDFQKRTGMTSSQYQAIQSLAPDDFSEVDGIYGETVQFTPETFYSK